MIRMPFPANTSSKRRRELAVAVADQELEAVGTFAEVHEQIAGLLRGLRAGGAGGDAQDAADAV
jgi:hypothetical protein